MTEPEGFKRQRRAPRVRVDGEVKGRIHTVPAAPVIDLSEGGALIEVPCSLHPGSVYVLRLAGGTLVLRGRVVRSYVHEVKRIASGETAITFRSALEFEPIADEQRASIRRLMADRRVGISQPDGETP